MLGFQVQITIHIMVSGTQTTMMEVLGPMAMCQRRLIVCVGKHGIIGLRLRETQSTTWGFKLQAVQGSSGVQPGTLDCKLS